MKIIIKSLKQISYDVEIPDTNIKVSELKSTIETLHGFDSKTIKLLYNGSILEDNKMLSDYNIANEHVIMMISSKVKPKNIQEEKKTEEVIPKKEEKVQKPATPKTEIKKKEDQPKYTKELQQLSEMGFAGDQSILALNAANGNIELAIDYLYNGIPQRQQQQHQQRQPMLYEFLDGEEDEEGEEGPMTIDIDPEFLSNLDLNNPDTIKTIASVVKIITSQDSSQLPDLLLDIEETNPEIIEYIKKHEARFKEEMEKPLNEEDLLSFNNLANPNDNPSVQDESDNIAESVPVSEEDKVIIERLIGLGFTEEECIQAYLACDKNEMLAANFLFESKFKDDMNIDCNIFLN